jgi:uncharacterized protein
MKQVDFHIKLLKHCNLRCSYCYEREYFQDPNVLSHPQIGLILDKIKNYALKKGISRIVLCFTGGEALLLGYEYLKDLFKLCRITFKATKIKIKLGLQTNLTLMDKRYIKLLKKYKVSVSSSFDVHGGQRKFISGTPADKIIIDKMIMMLKSRFPFGAVAVITKNNYKMGKKIYQLYKNMSTNFHSLKVHPWSKGFCPKYYIGASEYIVFLKSVADEHLREIPAKISMTIIDSYVGLLTKGIKHADLCVFSNKCLNNYVFIENNGDIYPCCSLRYPDTLLGNIFKQPLEKIMSSPVLRKLRSRNKFVRKECRSCKYVNICSGGCMAYSYLEGNILGKSKSWCAINRAMFNYIGKKLKQQGKRLLVPIS